MKKSELTPMMQQYLEIKEANADFILFYRLGDFYEMFFDDAKLASRELELTLTGRDCGLKERAPMCGVPYHSAESYLAKLVDKGYKVAICEQIEDPKVAKGLVKREIVRRVTPGTVVESSMLDESRNNFLCCLFADPHRIGICFADITTGTVYATSAADWAEIESELTRFSPKEVLVGGEASQSERLTRFLQERLEALREPQSLTYFDAEQATQLITSRFGITDFENDQLSLSQAPQTIQCIGGLLTYLQETQPSSLGTLNTLHIYQQGQYMALDAVARRNLELCETLRTKEKKGSLLWVLDRTKTAMGARLLRQWLEKPLYYPTHIIRRQQAVSALCGDVLTRSTLSDTLKQMFDMERLIGRIVYGTANCRDLRSLAATITHLPDIKQALRSFSTPLLLELTDQIDLLEDVRTLIESAILEEPPVTLRDGGMIQPTFNKDIDQLRDLASGGKGKIAAIEQRERETTGIKNLKIGYNRVFGYYIELSKSNIDAAPPHYVRKQTLANAERYITDELKQLENMVVSAQERLTVLEYEIFIQVRDHIANEVQRIQQTAQAVATVDVLCAFAELASENHYVCPVVDFSGRIVITDGRHPVVEKMLTDQLFIPNDTLLDGKDNRIAIITGPNMAGKSTYMRQVALLTIMAQIGSFVPATSAQIGVVDRIFTRVGASDDLASGQSTFMVEMREVAEILHHATPASLLILDEIGRGTSTYDGMSIARAVIEYVADTRKIGARTLFATHYHELTVLENLVDGIKNYNIAVKKRGDDITFLRKIIPGGADDSFGIAVAKLAGVPEPVIERAKTVLADLEAHTPKLECHAIGESPTNAGETLHATSAPHAEQETSAGEEAELVESAEQMTLQSISIADNAVTERLRTLSVETLTPIEALNVLYELKKMV